MPAIVQSSCMKGSMKKLQISILTNVVKSDFMGGGGGGGGENFTKVNEFKTSRKCNVTKISIGG